MLDGFYYENGSYYTPKQWTQKKKKEVIINDTRKK